MVWNREHKLGSKSLKPLCGKRLGKQLSKLILGGDKMKMKVSTDNPFSNKVVVNLNVFGTAMKNRVKGQGNGISVITSHSRSRRKINTQITENLS
jgi:hypothetical protein